VVSAGSQSAALISIGRASPPPARPDLQRRLVRTPSRQKLAQAETAGATAESAPARRRPCRGESGPHDRAAGRRARAASSSSVGDSTPVDPRRSTVWVGLVAPRAAGHGSPGARSMASIGRARPAPGHASPTWRGSQRALPWTGEVPSNQTLELAERHPSMQLSSSRPSSRARSALRRRLGDRMALSSMKAGRDAPAAPLVSAGSMDGRQGKARRHRRRATLPFTFVEIAQRGEPRQQGGCRPRPQKAARTDSTSACQANEDKHVGQPSLTASRSASTHKGKIVGDETAVRWPMVRVICPFMPIRAPPRQRHGVPIWKQSCHG